MVLPVHPEAAIKLLVQHDRHRAGHRLFRRAEGAVQVAGRGRRLGEVTEHEARAGDVHPVERDPRRLSAHLKTEVVDKV